MGSDRLQGGRRPCGSACWLPRRTRNASHPKTSPTEVSRLLDPGRATHSGDLVRPKNRFAWRFILSERHQSTPRCDLPWCGGVTRCRSVASCATYRSPSVHTACRSLANSLRDVRTPSRGCQGPSRRIISQLGAPVPDADSKPATVGTTSASGASSTTALLAARAAASSFDPSRELRDGSGPDAKHVGTVAAASGWSDRRAHKGPGSGDRPHERSPRFPRARGQT